MKHREAVENICSEIVENICNKVKNRLLGRTCDFERVLDESPSSKIFVGKLQPKDKGNFFKSIINPNSIGIEFSVTKKNTPKFEINIRFSVYYRVNPTYKEQLEKKSDDDIRKVMKRKDVTLEVECPLSPGTYNFKSHLQKALDEQVYSEFNKGQYFERLYRGRGSQKFDPIKHLESEEAFKQYIESRNGKTYDKIAKWDIDLRVQVNKRSEDVLNVRVELINETKEVKTYLEPFDPTIFDPEIEIELKDNELYEEELEFMRDVRNRKFRVPGRGINCAIIYKKELNRLCTTVLPTYKQKRLRPKDNIAGVKPKFKLLAEDPIPILEKILDEMEKYYSELRTSNLPGELIAEFKEQKERFKKGIKFISNDKNAEEAFKLMNQTMFEANDCAEDSSWYLFQIVFIVSNLRAVLLEETDVVEVLQVPTGGGKTWTYLGLVLFSIFYGRLTGREFGVTAWVKFPLRMLSLQQLEIIAKFISYANKIKCEKNLPGDEISVGYLVGGNNTPNNYNAAKEWKKNGRDFRVITECPFCKTKVELEFDDDKGRVYHKCTSNDCYAGRLPIYVVDYEIYRYMPSVVVSTLDKAAVLNYNYRAKSLLGGKVKKCPNYGYCYGDLCIYGDINWKKMTEVKCEYLEGYRCKKEEMNGYPPILLIQDELHMIRESDGCLDSYLEGIIEGIIKDFGGNGLKVIAPSATASGVDRQVFYLYFGKKARTFPVKLGNGEDFFFTQEENIHRISVGVLPIGRALNWATWHVIKEVEKAIQDEILEAEKFNDKIKLEILNKLYDIIVVYHRSKRDANELLSGLSGIINEELINEGYDPIPESKTEIITGERNLKQLRILMDRITTTDKNKKIKLIGSTLIISHGIDFDELNIMVFRGMPRSVGEYEQARSRVGRKYPALIFVVHHGNLIRDLSFYKYFNIFHKNVYEYLENVPLYRWAAKAVQKMAPSAILSALHSYFVDNFGRCGNRFYTYMNCSDLKDAELRKLIQRDDVKQRAKQYLLLTKAPSKYVGTFTREVESIVDLLFDSCSGRGNVRLAQIMHKHGFPVYNIRSIEKEVEFTPTHETNSIESRIDKIKIEAPPESRYSSTDEEKEDISYPTEEGEEV